MSGEVMSVQLSSLSDTLVAPLSVEAQNLFCVDHKKFNSGLFTVFKIPSDQNFNNKESLQSSSDSYLVFKNSSFWKNFLSYGGNCTSIIIAFV